MPTADEYRMGLNNLLQRRYGTNAASHLRWDNSRIGTDHSPTWISIAYVDDKQCGQGRGTDKGTAKEIAAEAAIRHLRRQWGHLLR